MIIDAITGTITIIEDTITIGNAAKLHSMADECDAPEDFDPSTIEFDPFVTA